jgi:hypothetical protein
MAKRNQAISFVDRELKRQSLNAIAQTAGLPKNTPTVNPIPTIEEFKAFANQCVIRSGTRLIRFDPLFDYQEAIARLIAVYPGLWLVKDRQLGLTELLICWMLFRAKLNPAYAGAVFSITEKDAHKVSKRIERMPSQIPDFEWEVDSISVRKPKDGGEMNFRPSTTNATRGLESVWDLMFDEAGFVPIIDEMYAASTPSQEMVGADARTFIVSTIPKEGLDSWFFERGLADNPDAIDLEELLAVARSGGFFNQTKVPLPAIPGFCAWEDKGGWVKVIISHKAHPIYGSNPQYVEEQRTKKKLTDAQAQREHNLGLPKQGASLFDPELVIKCATGQWMSTPEAGHSYLSCIDPNYGGQNFWVCQIWDITKAPFRLVAQYRENYKKPLYCRTKSMELIKRFNAVFLAVEADNGGVVIAEQISAEMPQLHVEITRTSQMSKIVNTDRITQNVEAGDVVFPSDWIGIKEARNFSALNRAAIVESDDLNDDTITCWAAGFAWLEFALTLKPKKYSVAGTVNNPTSRLSW